MKNLILMAVEKAKRLTDDELTEEIAQLESGRKKLRLTNERGRGVPLNELILPVLRREQERRVDLDSLRVSAPSQVAAPTIYASN